MNLDKIADERLFQNHSKETMKNWCQNLHYFHYMRARIGHNCEGDSFASHFTFTGREDLLEKLSQIGISPNTLAKDAIIFDPLGKYSIDNLDKIAYTIPGCDDLEQPKDVEVCGYKAYIWIQTERFEVSISGLEGEKVYEVSNKDFEACQAIEKKFEKLGWAKYLDEEIKSHAYCISEEKYPELY